MDTQSSTSTGIVISNNYFQDLQLAIASGILPANAKPKKDVLYSAIQNHNVSLIENMFSTASKAFEAPVTSATPATPNPFHALAKQWQAQREQKAAAKVAKVNKEPKPKVQRPGKSLDWKEVYVSDQVGFVKRSSFTGIVLARMFECGVKLSEYDILGLPSKRQVSQAIACISEKGYGVSKENDIYYLVLPNGLTEPKFSN
jgi:hypothetical protein